MNYIQTIKEAYAAMQHPMIHVDGEKKHMNNSEGKPIHHTEEGIRNFHRWFGDSKTVDEHGRPQVFYHGTNTDFGEFSHAFTGGGTDAHGAGFYFTTKPDVASHYAGSHILPVYLKVSKPINKGSDKPLARSHIHKVISGAPELEDTLTNFGDTSHEGHHKVLNSAVDSYTESSKFETMAMLHNDFYRGKHEQFLDRFKKATGHDGVIVPDENIVTVFHPSQIKSATGNDGSFDHPTKINEAKE